MTERRELSGYIRSGRRALTSASAPPTWPLAIRPRADFLARMLDHAKLTRTLTKERTRRAQMLDHDKLARTLTKERARRLRGRVRALVGAVGSDLVDLEDDEFARLLK